MLACFCGGIVEWAILLLALSGFGGIMGWMGGKIHHIRYCNRNRNH